MKNRARSILIALCLLSSPLAFTLEDVKICGPVTIHSFEGHLATIFDERGFPYEIYDSTYDEYDQIPLLYFGDRTFFCVKGAIDAGDQAFFFYSITNVTGI